MVTFSKPISANEPQGNGPQELKPIIPIECPQVHELTKGNYYMYKLHTGSYNANLPTYNLAIPFYNNGYVEEWLKCCQNLQAVITGQNIMDPQGMYAITKSMLRWDALTAFEITEEVNGPQTEPTYKKTMKDIHTHMCIHANTYTRMHDLEFRLLTLKYKRLMLLPCTINIIVILNSIDV